MQDPDFDKLFARKMGQIGGAAPSEAEWSAISERLDAHDRRRERRWVLPVFLPLFGLLAAGNWFWWQAWRASEQRFSNQKSRVELADTVVRRTVVFQTDTVFRTVVVKTSALPFSEKMNEKIGLLAAAKSGAAADGSLFSIKNELAKTSVAEAEKAAVPDFEKAAAEPKNAAQPTAHGRDTVFFVERSGDSLFQLLLAKLPTEKAPKPRVFFLGSPDLGIGAGICLPKMPSKISGFGRSLGLSGGVEFSRNWRLTASVARQWTGLQSSETSIFSASDVPQLGSEYALKYWEIEDMKSWEWAAGLRREWPNRSFFEPFLGISARWWQTEATEAKFEYRILQTGDEKEIEVTLPKDATRLGVLAEAGGNVRLSKNWGVGGKIGWRSAGQRLRLPGWGLGFESRLFYQF